LAAVWAEETGQPLRIIAGDPWIAGLLGIAAKERASILIDGDPALSPWITPERVEKDGMLIVWNARSNRLPQSLRRLIASHPVRAERFRWPRSSRPEDLVVNYAIVPPKPAQSSK
jgi:hypothetical protein